MSRYKGLFTFDVDNHRYIPVEQADGLVSDMNYHPESEEEPKEWWYLNEYNEPEKVDFDSPIDDMESLREIGFLFESEEEAEVAVRKLKAWKRLKDMGFKIEGIRYRNNKNYIEWSISEKFIEGRFTTEAFSAALHLLFGGEE